MVKAKGVRIGIDVGGTFTKAVAIDNETYEIIGKSSVLTTHYAPEGVARGIVEVFRKILEEHHIDPKDVRFIAHSTTQATNALLEGDVAVVGIVGMGTGFDMLLARRETDIGDIEVAPGRILHTFHSFIDTKKLNEKTISQIVQDLISKGANVIAVSEAFGVDDPTNERLVMKVCNDLGVLSTAGHEITKMLGLTVRTRTAVINASILPKMMETANMLEDAVRKMGIKSSLMIMRGDGGIMDINEVKKRPLMSILSGPAASVAGALMYLKVSDGIFFEVGGTSTNIGVIRNGRPMMQYVKIGPHRTYLNSLDVRVLGVAGGSMVRFQNKNIVDVGPRSAHIAGLPYSAFAETKEIVDPKMILIQPKPGDPSDYIAIKTSTGKTFAITNTCAANILGITKPGDYAYGNPEAAKRAFKPLAEALGLSIEEVAQRILEISATKIIKVIDELMEEYALVGKNPILVGGGGGASVLIPFVAKMKNLDYKISEHAEVISSIGVALAMVRDVVERVIVNPTERDILHIKKEAEVNAIKAGAMPETVEVFVEIFPKLHKVRAIAVGATELRAKDPLKVEITMEEVRKIAAKSLRVSPEHVELVARTEFLNVFTAKVKKRSFFSRTLWPIRVVDREGVVRLSLRNGTVQQCLTKQAENFLKEFINKNTKISDMGLVLPRLFILYGKRILDLSGLQTSEQMVTIALSELKGINPEETIVMVAEKM